MTAPIVEVDWAAFCRRTLMLASLCAVCVGIPRGDVSASAPIRVSPAIPAGNHVHATASLIAANTPSAGQRSLTDRSINWPTWSQWQRVLLLQDYNTRIVVFGTSLLGLAAGLVGSFTLLRKRALMGDALAHASLPGIAIAFIAATTLGGNGKSLPTLLLGAAVSGLIGVAVILFIRGATRIKEDTALAVVLSVFFGLGIALLGVAQQMGQAAGLEAFIYGKTASMVASDAGLIAGSALLSVLACLFLFKELKLLCFDENFAGSRGYPVLFLDIALMAIVVLVTIVGLQAVGLVLIIALLVIPSASARFWTERLFPLAVLAAILGALGCLIGSSLSAIFPRLPSGAMIVLTASLFFVVSMIFGSRRGVLVRFMRRRGLNRRVDRQHLLREMFELTEQHPSGAKVDFGELFSQRTWSHRRLKRAIRHCIASGYLTQESASRTVCLTDPGLDEARRLTRQHRLWELYLIHYADIAPSRVDRDADAIEHVLEREQVAELESLLHAELTGQLPLNPHASDSAGASPAFSHSADGASS